MSDKELMPIVEVVSGVPTKDSTERHPAYAQIGASRVTATPGSYLYGSDFRHHNYVVIRIGDSELNRSLSHDWPHSHHDYIEVALSEAQWATFVSTLNVGQGVQCTLQAKDGRRVPSIQQPMNRREQFTGEMAKQLAATEASLGKLKTLIESSAMSKKAKDEMLSSLGQVSNHLTPNIAFVGRSFGEYVERTMERAKIEVNAHVQNVLVRLGMKHAQMEQPIEIDESDKERDLLTR